MTSLSYPNHSPWSVLRSLHAGLAGSADTVRITLHTRNTLSFTGILLHLDEDDGRTYAVISQGDMPTQRMVHIWVDDVVAVEIHHPSQYAALIHDPLPAPSQDTAPTQLELKRKAASLLEGKLIVGWDDVPDSYIARHWLGLVLDGLQKSFEDMSGSKEGMSALVSLSEIRLSHKDDTTLALTRQERSLVLQHDFARPLPQRYQRLLQNSLNSVL